MIKPFREYLDSFIGKQVEVFLDSESSQEGKCIRYDENFLYLVNNKIEIKLDFKNIFAIGEILASIPGIAVDLEEIESRHYPPSRVQMEVALTNLFISYVKEDVDFDNYCWIGDLFFYGWSGFKNFSDKELKKMYYNSLEEIEELKK